MGVLNIALLLTTVVLCRALTGDSTDQLCMDVFGRCQSNCTRVGYYVTDLCHSPNKPLCCIPEFKDKQCRLSFGECKNMLLPDQCRGRFISGLCNGPSYRQCCIPV